MPKPTKTKKTKKVQNFSPSDKLSYSTSVQRELLGNNVNKDRKHYSENTTSALMGTSLYQEKISAKPLDILSDDPSRHFTTKYNTIIVNSTEPWPLVWKPQTLNFLIENGKLYVKAVKLSNLNMRALECKFSLVDIPDEIDESIIKIAPKSCIKIPAGITSVLNVRVETNSLKNAFSAKLRMLVGEIKSHTKYQHDVEITCTPLKVKQAIEMQNLKVLQKRNEWF